MNQFAPMLPRGIPLEPFRIFSKIRGDICMSGVQPPVSTTLVVQLELRISPFKLTAEQPMGGQEVYMYLTITVQSRLPPPPPPPILRKWAGRRSTPALSPLWLISQLIPWGMVMKLVIAGSVGINLWLKHQVYLLVTCPPPVNTLATGSEVGDTVWQVETVKRVPLPMGF